MSALVLAVNAGSSTLKLSVVDGGGRAIDRRHLETTEPAAWEAALSSYVIDSSLTRAVGHRIVHGGPSFTGPVAITDDDVARLDQLAELAPLHNAPALAAVRIVRRLTPGLPQVACFDTAFHATLPPAASTYAVPAEWNRRFGFRRFGFHGLSHAYASRRAAEILDRDLTTLRVVTAHIGSGASLAAVDSGRSVDTTMGFTPLEGLVMATRSGTVDPGLLLWVARHSGLSLDEIDDALEHRSGLAGLSGTSGDMREVIDAADRGDAAASLALDVYVHRLRAGVAAMASSMGGLDALVFTGGVGEHSAVVRARTCDRLDFLGITIDDAANSHPTDEDRRVSAEGARVAVLVVETREDLEIARQVRRLLGL